MANRDTAALKAAAAALLSDTAAAYSIDPSEVATLLDDFADSRGIVAGSVTGNTLTLTLADGTTVVFTAAAPARPTDAQYHALITTGTTRPTATQLTTGPDHRDSTDGDIAGWPARTTNAYLWIWSSHTLSSVSNGDGRQNQISGFNAPVRLTVGSVNGYLYRSDTVLYPAATNLNWRVS